VNEIWQGREPEREPERQIRTSSASRVESTLDEMIDLIDRIGIKRTTFLLFLFLNLQFSLD